MSLASEDDVGAMKRAVVRFDLEQVVPEALGLRAAASASADVLYQISAGKLAPDFSISDGRNCNV